VKDAAIWVLYGMLCRLLVEIYQLFRGIRSLLVRADEYLMMAVMVSSALFIHFCQQTTMHHGSDCSGLVHLPKEMECCAMVQNLCPWNTVSLGKLCYTLHNMYSFVNVIAGGDVSHLLTL
jgi:hypothetical protein